MLIYQYCDGLDGFLSAVFRAYEEKALPDLITDGALTEPPLLSQIVTIPTDEAKAIRIERGICDRLGISGLHQLSYAYASGLPEKNKIIFYWVLSVFKYGKEVQKRYHDQNVMDFCDMTARVTLEIHRNLNLHFSQNTDGLFCSEISPDNNILPFLMPHFTRKLHEQPFLICDCKRKLYGIYNGNEWKVLYSEQKSLPVHSAPNEAFQTLWQEYYRAVAVTAREKKRTQDSYLPRRYRAFLTEFRE